MTLLGDVEICRWIPDLVPDRIFVGISFQNKGEDNSTPLVFPLPANQLPGSTWKILPAKPKNQRQPMSTCYHDHQLSCRPKAFHFVPNPDAIDFSRFPKCLMFQFGYTCSGLEGYASWNDMWRVGTVATVTIFCSPGSHAKRWIPKCWFSKKTWDDADPKMDYPTAVSVVFFSSAGSTIFGTWESPGEFTNTSGYFKHCLQVQRTFHAIRLAQFSQPAWFLRFVSTGFMKSQGLPSSYWKWPFIVAFAIKNCDFP